VEIRFFRTPTAVAGVAVLIVLVLSMAPAFGQSNGDDVQYSAVCQNLIGSIGDISQNQEGNATASAQQYAKVAQEQGISIAQINECLNGEASGGDTDKEHGAVDDPSGVRSASIPEVKALVNTGGIPLLVGAGLLFLSSIAVGSMVIGRR